MTSRSQMTADEITTVNLAMGRIFGLMSRPTQEGDIADYERCRSLILNTCGDVAAPYAHDYARDRLKGAAGDF